MFIVGAQQLTFYCQCVRRKQVFNFLSAQKHVKVRVHADLQTQQIESLYSLETFQMNCGIKLASFYSKNVNKTSSIP